MDPQTAEKSSPVAASGGGSLLRRWPVVIGIIIVAWYFSMLYLFGVNIPFSDDYTEILRPLNSIMGAESLGKKLEIIFTAPGYSKVILLRVVVVLLTVLTGSLNLKVLLFLGNICLVGVVWVLSAAAPSRRGLLLLPIPLILFQLQYWEAAYVPTLAMSVMPALLLSFAAILLASRPGGRNVAGAVICAFLAMIAFGNGIFAFPVAAAVLLYQRRFRAAGVTILLFAISVALYFHNYSVPGSTAKVATILSDPLRLAKWFLAFVGSSAGYVMSSGYDTSSAAYAVSIAAGVAVTGLFVYLTVTRYFSRNIVLYSFFTFLMLTAALTTRYRVLSEVPSASRYQIQSVLLIVVCYLVLVDILLPLLSPSRLTQVAAAALVASIAFNVMANMTNYGNVTSHKTKLVDSMHYWTQFGMGLGRVFWGDTAEAGRILTTSTRTGIYRPPAY